jgi:hypothetical protein
MTMAKKTFKENPAGVDRYFSTPPHETHDTDKTYDTYSDDRGPKHYRLNLKLKAEYKEYLDQVSWENHKSITQYLNDLIEADKATHNR